MYGKSSQIRTVGDLARRTQKKIPFLVCLIPGLLVGCAAIDLGPDPWITFTLVGQSANVPADQGYASGGTVSGSSQNYFFATKTLFLSSTYNTLTVVARNDDVLVPGTNHLGTGDVYGGKVYGVIERWSGCGAPDAPIFIAVFDAQTLALEKTFDISRDLPEASGITIDPDSGEAIVTSFCDSSSLYAYKLSDLSFSRKIPLAIRIADIQGAAYKDGFLYIARTDGVLYGLRLRDNAMRLVYRSHIQGEFEGLDFHTDQLRWLVNQPGDRHILYSYEPRVG